MPEPSPSHLVLIPSYNTGPKLAETVRAALAEWAPVWVVVDGSTDGSDADLDAIEADDGALRVLRLGQNRGKGAAVLYGVQAAAEAGFTHALTMDADGQHPADQIGHFMERSASRREALVLGTPQFGDEAPALRVNGRKVSNFWANLETLWGGIGDSLFGMRVYPIADLRAVMEPHRFARRFDFDPEVAVRLCWRGLPLVNLPTPVRYFTAEEGGVSQFRYLRDNTLLTWMHVRLMAGFLFRLPALALARVRGDKKTGDKVAKKG